MAGFLLALLGAVLLTIAALGAFLAANVRLAGPRMRAWNTRLLTALQLAVLAGGLMDWAYGAFLASPVGLVVLGQHIVALPFALALVMLLRLRVAPTGYGWQFALGGMQLTCLFAVLPVLEQRVQLSFLAGGTVLTLAASAGSLLVLVGFLIQDVPPPHSWRGRIVYLRREQALAAIPAVAARLGLRYQGPRTILDLGSAEGRVGDADVRIDTEPLLWPPRYRARVRASGPHLARGAPALPPGWHATRRGPLWVASYASTTEMPLTEATLTGIIEALTAPASPADPSPGARAPEDP